MKNSYTALLSNKGEYSTFQFQNRTIKFLTGSNLDHYTKVIEWDHGYLVVMCKTKSDPDNEEEDFIYQASLFRDVRKMGS